MKHPGVKAAIEAAGGIRRLAALLGMKNHQPILRWKQIPTNRLLQIEDRLGIPREQLRPDLYRRSR